MGFLNQFDIGGRSKRENTDSGRTIKLSQISRITMALDIKLPITFSGKEEADKAIDANVEKARANLFIKRVPAAALSLPQEVERMAKLTADLEEKGVVILGRCYIAATVNTDRLTHGLIQAGTIILGKSSLGDNCILSGTIIDTVMTDNVAIINLPNQTVRNCRLGGFSEVQSCNLENRDIRAGVKLTGLDDRKTTSNIAAAVRNDVLTASAV
jgi:hypothetical protein